MGRIWALGNRLTREPRTDSERSSGTSATTGTGAPLLVVEHGRPVLSGSLSRDGRLLAVNVILRPTRDSEQAVPATKGHPNDSLIGKEHGKLAQQIFGFAPCVEGAIDVLATRGLLHQGGEIEGEINSLASITRWSTPTAPYRM